MFLFDIMLLHMVSNDLSASLYCIYCKYNICHFTHRNDDIRKIPPIRTHVKESKTEQSPRPDIADLDLPSHLEELIYQF